MKKIFSILIILLFSVSLFSCGSSAAIQQKEKVEKNKEKEIITYTLKNNKELMNQKITNRRNRTIIASL